MSDERSFLDLMPVVAMFLMGGSIVVFTLLNRPLEFPPLLTGTGIIVLGIEMLPSRHVHRFRWWLLGAAVCLFAIRYLLFPW
jgi:hypothetical protein